MNPQKKKLKKNSSPKIENSNIINIILPVLVCSLLSFCNFPFTFSMWKRLARILKHSPFVLNKDDERISTYFMS